MLQLKKVDFIQQLSELKSQYFAQAIAPLDGESHLWYVSMGIHLGFYDHDQLVGYCCINRSGYLLQFFWAAPELMTSQQAFAWFRSQTDLPEGIVLKGALVSTAEPLSLALVADHAQTCAVKNLQFEQQGTVSTQAFAPELFRCATKAELKTFVEFAIKEINAMPMWVRYYYAFLIRRNELFGYWQDDVLLAIGEFRRFDQYQTSYVELGIAVAASHRQQGIGQQVIAWLIAYGNQQGLRAIATSSQDNQASAKTLQKAGLTLTHRMIQFEF